MKRWFNKNLIGFSLASFLNDTCHEMATAILPVFIKLSTSAHFAPAALGLVEGISDAASTLIRLLSGWLADRVQFYKPYLIVGYGITGIFIALIGTTNSIALIIVYKTIAWMSRGLREPMRDAWLSKIIDRSFYGRAFGIERALDTLGALLGPFCAFFLLKKNYSLSSIFFIALIPGILSILPIALLTRESEEQTKNKNIKFLEQLKLLPKDFKFFLVNMFLFGIANFNQTFFLYRAHMIISQHTSSAMLSTALMVLLYAVFNIARGFSELGMGTLSDFINRKNLLALFGIGLFGITCLGFTNTSKSLWIWTCLFCCAGFSTGTVKALEKAHAADLLPTNVRGTGIGALQTIDGAGDLISSILVGGLWTFIGPQLGFIYAAVISFIAMGMLLMHHKQN